MASAESGGVETDISKTWGFAIGTGLVAEFLLPWSCATFKARRDANEFTYGAYDCLERFFGANPFCVVRKVAVQFTGQQRLDPLANTSQMYQPSSPAELGNRNQQWWRDLAETARLQPN